MIGVGRLRHPRKHVKKTNQSREFLMTDVDAKCHFSHIPPCLVHQFLFPASVFDKLDQYLMPILVNACAPCGVLFATLGRYAGRIHLGVRSMGAKKEAKFR